MALVFSAIMLSCESGLQWTHQTLKPLNLSTTLKALVVHFAGNLRRRGAAVACYVSSLRSVEERFRIQMERNVDEKKLHELNVKWCSKRVSDVCVYDYEWEVDEQEYIVKGCMRVAPEDCKDCTYFYVGDLVRFLKWLNAMLNFEGEYEQRYRFNEADMRAWSGERGTGSRKN